MGKHCQDPKPHERSFEVDGGEKTRVDSEAQAAPALGLSSNFHSHSHAYVGKAGDTPQGVLGRAAKAAGNVQGVAG